ncbi:MFS transporter [Litoreibacter roseus]|uniref:MFS transporter n=2 Tax=Litoreibacter roseus TaxID=2601869 RepID=A0A6N6JE80_9RHOB|nr:MFS transporter [Litoreibacter roseus]
MRASLDGSLVQAQWISNAYMLGLSALILVGGAAGDRFGLARVFSYGIMLFVIASIACALAPTAEILIVARGIQGVGAAFMVPGSLALISRAYPKAERGRAIGIWASAAAVTSALGPIIGGLAMTSGGPETWRWIFGINLPLGAIALYLLWTRVARDQAQSQRGIDVAGGLLATIGLGLFALALTGAEHGQAVDGQALTLGLIAIAACALFLLVEARSAHPMMPLGLFRNSGFSAANGVSFLIYFAFSAILFYLPMTVIGGWGVTEIETAAAFAPLSVFIAALSGAAGRWADKFGPGPLLAGGSLVLSIGYGALALVIPSQNFWGAVMPAMCFQGIGMGLVVAPLSTAIMGAVESEATGIASGINNAVTRMAGLIAVAAMGSVVAITYTAANGPDSFGAMVADPAHAIATNAAFSQVAWIACVLCILSAIASALWVPRRSRSA